MGEGTNGRVCVYTTVFERYDDVKPQPEQTIPCDFYCFTDEPARVAPPWRAIVAGEGPLPGVAPKTRSRYLKAMPHCALDEIGGAPPYAYTIWIDASVRVLRSAFAERMVAAADGVAVAALAHPERDCIYDELEATLGPATAGKYDGDGLREQVAHYRARGYPARNGLLACGVLARRTRDDAARRVSEAWWEETRRWSSMQDQISLPYVLWRLGARCRALDLNLWRNPLFEVVPHLDPATGGRLRAARPEYSAEVFRERPNGHALGAYVPERGLWRLPSPDPGRIVEFSFGPADRRMIPITGDWDGDGVDSPGVYDPGTGAFFLRNSATGGDADVAFAFGPPGAIPLAGDWDGSGRDRIGVFVPEHGYWALASRNEPGAADVHFHFGEPGPGTIPVAGDWDGSGRDRVGLYAAASSSWFLIAENRTGAGVDMFDFGPERSVPIAGDWDGDGADEIGVYVPEQGQAFLAHANRRASACSRALVDPPNSWPVVVRRP